MVWTDGPAVDTMDPMNPLVLIAGIGAVCSAVGLVRIVWRWLRIRGRPVLTCAEFAAVEPGTAVVVVGRTADGPLLTTPRSHQPCVGYQSVFIRNHTVSDNYEESTISVGPERGDVMLHGDDGARVRLAYEIRSRNLFVGEQAMMVIGAEATDHDKVSHDRRTERELFVPASRAVVAAGTAAVVDGDPGQLILNSGSWVDGSGRGGVDGLSRRFAGNVALLATSTLGLVGLTIVLI